MATVGALSRLFHRCVTAERSKKTNRTSLTLRRAVGNFAFHSGLLHLLLLLLCKLCSQ